MIVVLDILYSVLVLMMVVQGLAIIFGLLRVINLAHGELMMLGAYSLWLLSQTPVPFVFSLLITAVGMAAVGGVMYYLVIKRIRHRLLDTILATWGVSIVLQQLIRLCFGSGSQHLEAPTTQLILLFGHDYPLYRLIVMGLSLLSLAGLYVLFFGTRFGVKARAVISNPTLATAAGLPAEKLYLISFMIGGMMAGVAGAVIAPTMSISPLMGGDYLVPAFLSVLIGGLGSIISALSGAAVIAGSQSLLTVLFDPVIAQLGMLGLAIALLKWFPSGLFK
ncbi:branched-chain amino acid ABC transporter permease [Ostreibacterium oceani]|uniref:Branched-chain amino acid ABC transporter permease n=1 Tax=Ostreibacterium oceani TaxID=2654998 RepID=A0A6N7ESS9_9GAMM|nr:branched-chain amino acid ABC transporter permease [Ostreibacterium oceani]MPV85894.1 branched-chain amino acid ABC transporter permease [Ostreibacterium oceani]